MKHLATFSAFITLVLSPALAMGQIPGQAQPETAAQPAPDERLLGEFVVEARQQEHVTTLAVLPSLEPDLEDVIVRGVVRHDLELSGMFRIIEDRKAPEGMYGFNDPVDVPAWRKLGAEVIVKVAARKHESGKIQVFGIAYLTNVGDQPVYEKKLLVPKEQVRVTAHRVTDALIGAITGIPGSFASRFAFAARWGRNRRIFSMDADGHDLKPITDPEVTSIAPFWGPGNQLFYTESRNYSPFRLTVYDGTQTRQVPLMFASSVYSVAISPDKTKMAVAVAEGIEASVYLSNIDGSNMTKVSKTPLATHPVFSPTGKLAWIGGTEEKGSQRVWLDGKPVSPQGFVAASPTFCDTEDGVRLVYSVSVGNDRRDLVMANENGGVVGRLTQNQGSNTYPACSPDGRLLSFFSTRKSGDGPGTYMMSLKRWTTRLVTKQLGESLRWASLPPPPPGTEVP